MCDYVGDVDTVMAENQIQGLCGITRYRDEVADTGMRTRNGFTTLRTFVIIRSRPVLLFPRLLKRHPYPPNPPSQ